VAYVSILYGTLNNLWTGMNGNKRNNATFYI